MMLQMGKLEDMLADVFVTVKGARVSLAGSHWQAHGADAMEYWGEQLLRLHERPYPLLDECALDECALALAMSQHTKLGIESCAAGLGPDLLERIFGLVRAEAAEVAAVAARACEARRALWTCCIHTLTSTMARKQAGLRVLHFLQAHAQDSAHFVRACNALSDRRGACCCPSCERGRETELCLWSSFYYVASRARGLLLAT